MEFSGKEWKLDISWSNSLVFANFDFFENKEMQDNMNLYDGFPKKKA